MLLAASLSGPEARRLSSICLDRDALTTLLLSQPTGRPQYSAPHALHASDFVGAPDINKRGTSLTFRVRSAGLRCSATILVVAWRFRKRQTTAQLNWNIGNGADWQPL